MNPGKISGLCGRLKCCLRYEADAYQDARLRQPNIGDTLPTPNGEARVVAVNLLRENAAVQLPEGTKVTVSWNALAQGDLTESTVDVRERNQRAETPRPAKNVEVKKERPKPESPPPASPANKSGTKAKSSGKRRRWRKRKAKRAPGAQGS